MNFSLTGASVDEVLIVRIKGYLSPSGSAAVESRELPSAATAKESVVGLLRSPQTISAVCPLTVTALL